MKERNSLWYSNRLQRTSIIHTGLTFNNCDCNSINMLWVAVFLFIKDQFIKNFASCQSCFKKRDDEHSEYTM